jgi:protein O-GlcNAc transferase
VSDDPADTIARAAIAERSGDLPLALVLGQRAVAAAPDLAAAWFVLGTAQHRLGQLSDAVRSLQRAALLAPGEPSISRTLGMVAYADGQVVVATEALLALAQAPGDTPPSELVEPLALLAQLLCQSGRPADGERYAKAALGCDPDNNNARIAMAACLFGKRYGSATQNIGSDPADVPGLLMLASAFEGQRKPERAQPLYARVLALDPQNRVAMTRQLDVALTMCNWTRYDDLVATVLQKVRDDVVAGQGLSFDVFNLLPLPVDANLILAASRVQAARHATGLAPVFPPPRCEDRIRLAYLLPYTDRHSLPQALRGVIEHHNRSRFEVIGYSLRICDGSPFSRDFRACFDAVHDLDRAEPASGAARIRTDQVDILVDTTGHTGLNALPVLAQRAAPLQAHYLGYGLTSGAEYVDYLITDRRFLGPGGEAYISEAPVFLPHSFMATMRAPIADEQRSRAAEGLPEDGVVFANFNHPCKLDPLTFALWMLLLRTVAGSVLWLGAWAAGTQERLLAAAAAQGVSPDRLVFARLAPHPIHLRRLQLADIALDNRLHGGGVTTVDALWAGLPVVSLAGANPPSRLGASLLSAAGVPELVVNTPEDYVALALTLANDPMRRRELRARLISARDSSPLFDVARQTRDLEAAYVEMWRRYGAGLPPGPISIEASASSY